MAKRPGLGRALRVARTAAGLTQEQAASALGVVRQTIGSWEAEGAGTDPSPSELQALAEVYQVDPAALVVPASARAVREEVVLYQGPRPTSTTSALIADLEARSKRIALRRRLPPKVYAVVHEYLERLADAGVDEEMVDEAERLMTEFNYSKLHKTSQREATEDDQILRVRAIWDAIEITLRDQGVKL